MPTQLQFRRGTTSQNNSFTGAVGEISVDTTLDTIRIHDGSTAGGFALVSDSATQTLTNKTLTTPVIAEIDSGSTITLDATTDINLDAGGADIVLKDDGTEFGRFTQSGGELIIKSSSSASTAATFSGSNVTFAGTLASGAITSSSTVTATQGIFSNASPLIFEGNTADSFETTIAVADPTADRTVTIQDATTTLVGRDTTDTLTNKTLTTPVIAEIDSTGSITLDAATDIILDADGADITLKDGGTTFGALNNNGGNLRIQSGSTPTTAITMSGANVTIAGNLTVSGSTTTIDSSTIDVTNSFTFEGSTADSFETTLTVEDPTADRTVTIPNATTQLVGRDTTDTLTNKTLTTPVITEIDSGSTITLDAATDINLDAAGNNITLKTGGTTSLDFVLNGATDVTLDAPGDIKVDADGGDVLLLDGGSQFASLTNNSSNLIIKSGTTTAATFSGANVVFAGTLQSDTITTTGSVVFEGATANSFETTLAVVDPTADRTITFQNGSGTVAFLTDVTGGGAAAFSNVELTGGVIFEGSTADSFETTLNVVDPTADRTINLPNDSGTVALQLKSFDLNGSELILDEDADTSIHASTDDQIDIKIANADDFTFTANTFNVLSGSSILIAGNIDMNGSELILDADADTSITASADDQIDFRLGGNDRITFTTGLIDLKNDGAQSAIRMYCESSNAHYAALTAPAHSDFSGNITITLPADTTTLVGTDNTVTLTNKTLTSPTIATPAITGNTTTTGSFIFEGSTADSFETTLGVVDPTADRTINLANIGGTLQPFAAASTDQISATPAEINLIDGGTSRGTTALADGDGILINDGGTMRMTNVTTVKTYMQGGISLAYDDFTAGDAAVNVTTTSGNITIDAQGNDTDIIFKGTDGSADTTFVTIDGSAAGETTFNAGINLGGNVVFEGSTANSFETTLTVIDPTADRTVSIPNETFKVSSGANKATLAGDGSTTTVTIASGYNVNQFLVTINGVVQEPTEDFTISGTTLTLDAAPASGDRVVVRY
tara:strand:+ start:31043 stop:34096 length:3054 start_codon:yes stop_codon:yes gene_type:complete